MSVIKQPFQMLPFSQSIESQWRLRSDCFNDICDVPIIPKGKFVPFAIIANSDNIGQITIHCWDEPFSYIRIKAFTRDNCPSGYGEEVIFSKTYYSTISNQDAYEKAMTDPNFLIEGQQYANDNGQCVIGLPDFYDPYSNQYELDNYTIGSSGAQGILSISSGHLDFIGNSAGTYPLLSIERVFNNLSLVEGNSYKISFDIISVNPATVFVFEYYRGWTSTYAATVGYHEITIVAGSADFSEKFAIIFVSFDTGNWHVVIDNLKLESL